MMKDTNPVQQLKHCHPTTELWWDSSPLVYADWLRRSDHPHWGAPLFQMVRTPAGAIKFTADSLLDGATTNQPLTWQVIETSPDVWAAWITATAGQAGRISAREALWRLFIEIAARGADMLEPIFVQSQGRLGQICCQVDPRHMTDLEAMLAQARRIHAARPNIMVKMPGTREGIAGVRILTAEGIPTNTTLCFTLPQLVAVGEATQVGLAEAHRGGTDLSCWRSCAVMMLGRYEDMPLFKAQAQELGIDLSEADLRWAGIAIFRKAHRLFHERGYPCKLMAASMRPGPTVDGRRHVWHLEKLAGAHAVLTIFPNIFEQFMDNYAGLQLTPQIDEPVPADVLERLLRIPYFAEAYDAHGIAAADFVTHPALQATATSFARSMQQIESFAAQHAGTDNPGSSR